MDNSLKSLDDFLKNIIDGKYKSFNSLYEFLNKKNKNFVFVKLEDLSKNNILIKKNIKLFKLNSILNKNNSENFPIKNNFVYYLRIYLSKFLLIFPPVIYNSIRVKITESMFVKIMKNKKVEMKLKSKFKEKFNL